MQASELPGGVIKQRYTGFGVEPGDCFSACVSMLTGINLDILPVLPPLLDGTFYSDGSVTIKQVEDLDPWLALLNDNGYIMDLTTDKPMEYPFMIGLLIEHGEEVYGHTIVALNEDEVIDPLEGEVVPYIHNATEGVYFRITEK